MHFEAKIECGAENNGERHAKSCLVTERSNKHCAVSQEVASEFGLFIDDIPLDPRAAAGRKYRHSYPFHCYHQAIKST